MEAGQRLAALSDYTELGAGFKVAMRDLELRGAGNLLGDEQSGHVAALGFELYMQMLDEAVQALAGEEEEAAFEPVRMDVSVDAYIPADYIPYEQAKVDVHRRIAGARDVADLALLRDELEDRFGPVPEPLSNLILLQQARIKLGRGGVVTFRGGRLAATPVELDSTRAKELRRRLPGALYESGCSAVLPARAGGPGAALPRRRAGGRRAARGRLRCGVGGCGGLAGDPEKGPPAARGYCCVNPVESLLPWAPPPLPLPSPRPSPGGQSPRSPGAPSRSRGGAASP